MKSFKLNWLEYSKDGGQFSGGRKRIRSFPDKVESSTEILSLKKMILLLFIDGIVITDLIISDIWISTPLHCDISSEVEKNKPHQKLHLWAIFRHFVPGYGHGQFHCTMM